MVLTVDLPVIGTRYRGMADREGLLAEVNQHMDRPFNLDDIDAPNPGLTWDDLPRIMRMTSLPLILKGVLHPDDARRAADAGVAAIVVSNHGGRQLDGCLATADALPPIVEAVQGRVEIYVDGGIRSGADVLRALALGAQAVLVGRPYIWALAVGGADGVAALLERYRAELATALALCGCTRVADAGHDILQRSG